ncbi:hypothetical protein ACQQ2Q_05810 [Agrobacterium sp. ES01]|uniref:hypothetical protein n=1 Tax=Agrobacterium sp. ES01 TaxID=3420714 RepID=UPI003D0F64D0
MRALSSIVFSTLLLPMTSFAEETAADGRFALERIDNGLVRLDTRTGAMSLCQEKDGNLICRMAADERAAYEEQLDMLEDRVAALEAGKPGANSRRSSANKDLPSDEEVDRSIGIMERFMRSFFGIVKEFEGEKESTAPHQTPGQL